MTIILIGMGTLFVAWIVWKLMSHRYVLPCPTWLGWMVEQDNPFVKNHRAASIIENMDLQSGMTVLDAGCGPGRLTIPVAKKLESTGNVIAMDIQDGMLDKVKNKAQKLNINNIRYIHAGLGENKLPLAEFDRALLVTVLGEIPNRKSALQEIFSSLKPGGILSITEIILDPHYQRQSTLVNLVTSIGFEEHNRFGNWIGYTINFKKPD